jgi:hypothetical protein
MRNATTEKQTQRLVDLTAGDLATLIDERLAAALTNSPAPVAPLDRAGAAQYLKVSLAKLDSLCRDPKRPLKFHRCGDAKRFYVDELKEFLTGGEVQS